MAIVKQKQKLTERGIKKYHTFKGVDDKLKELIYSLVDAIVYFDPDVDGCISGFLVCKFLAKRGIPFTWYINSLRSHDWTLPIEAVSGKDIIAVDFIVEASTLMELCDAGCNVVSIDHHVNPYGKPLRYVSDYDTVGYLINNQFDVEEEDSRYLSGAGVVYETLVALDPEFDTVEHRALVGITLLSDIRDIENPLAEGYLYDLYSHKYKGLIKYFIDATMGEVDYGFGLPCMDRSYVDYKFSPAINACLRFNEQDQIVNFFLGSNMLDLEYREEQKKLVKEICESLKIIDFPHLRVCYFYEKDFIRYKDVLSCFVGLVASKNLDGERSVICYMIGGSAEVPCIKRASFRGNISGLDYQSALSELFECLGHKPAFGIKGLVPNKKTFTRVNELCKLVENKANYSRNIVEVANLSMFNAKKIAEDNMYKLSQNMTFIKYTGNNIKKVRAGGNYIEYSVNGVVVKCFDVKKKVEDSLIYPILERGLLTFYLQ